MFWNKKHGHDPSLSPKDDPTSLGNLIVEYGLVPADKLEALIEDFKKYAGTMLGEFLVSKNILTTEKLSIILLKQKARRNGGVEHEQVMEALNLATDTQRRVDAQVDRLVETTTAAAAKARSK
jgi:hypothetical protein